MGTASSKNPDWYPGQPTGAFYGDCSCSQPRSSSSEGQATRETKVERTIASLPVVELMDMKVRRCLCIIKQAKPLTDRATWLYWYRFSPFSNQKCTNLRRPFFCPRSPLYYCVLYVITFQFPVCIPTATCSYNSRRICFTRFATVRSTHIYIYIYTCSRGHSICTCGFGIYLVFTC